MGSLLSNAFMILWEVIKLSLRNCSLQLFQQFGQSISLSEFVKFYSFA